MKCFCVTIEIYSAEEFYLLVPSFYNFSIGNVSNFVSWHLHDKMLLTKDVLTTGISTYFIALVVMLTYHNLPSRFLKRLLNL